MSPDEVAALVRGLILPQSVTWDFDRRRIGTEGAQVLAEALRENTAVRHLGLQSNDFGADAAKLLADALKGNSTVQSLDLKGNWIGDEGAKYLAEALADNTTLENISLEGNGIGVEGCQSLADAMKLNNSVRHLNLRSNRLGNQGARCLASMLKSNSVLQDINVQGNEISAALTQSLQAATKRNKDSQEDRIRDRWGLGLEAPDAGVRAFFPDGWVLERDVWQAIAAFGLDEDSIQFIMDRSKNIAETLGEKNVFLDAEQVAPVYAYTQPSPLHTKCNQACRTPAPESKNDIALYRDYLYHLTQATIGLPNYRGRAYRGIKVRIQSDCYALGKTVTWQPFSSATIDAKSIQSFVSCKSGRLYGSLFVLDIKTGRDIHELSHFPWEGEVLLGLNSMWVVTGRCHTQEEKEEKAPDLAGFDLSEVEVYTLRQR